MVEDVKQVAVFKTDGATPEHVALVAKTTGSTHGKICIPFATSAGQAAVLFVPEQGLPNTVWEYVVLASTPVGYVYRSFFMGANVDELMSLRSLLAAGNRKCLDALSRAHELQEQLPDMFLRLGYDRVNGTPEIILGYPQR